MDLFNLFKNRILPALILLFLIAVPDGFGQSEQKFSLGIHADPTISWFSTDISEIKNDGARPGFNFGLTFNSYFSPNYSFSTGITLINAAGRLTAKDSVVMEFRNFNETVQPGKPVTYKIQYLAIPIGLKLQTNQIGYTTFFTDLGLDPKVVIGGKADIPSLDIKGENAMNELRLFNLSYHITAGIEYSLGGTTAILARFEFRQ